MAVPLEALEPEQALHVLERQKQQKIAIAIVVLAVVFAGGLGFIGLAYSGEPEAAAPAGEMP
jgi:hypothetical protein